MRSLHVQVLQEDGACSITVERDGRLQEMVVRKPGDFRRMRSVIDAQLAGLERAFGSEYKKRIVVRLLPNFLKLIIRKSA